MTDRREACITFQRMTRAQLPTSEYTILRQLFQKLTSGLSNAKDVHEAICAILRRHSATELLALFERLVAMGTLAPPCAASLKRPVLGQSRGSDGDRGAAAGDVKRRQTP